MDEFVDQQEKRVIWPRASKINLLSHTGPNFTKQLLKKVVVKHFRASSTVWSPYNTTTSMRVVITGKVLVQKNTRADFELKSCLSISPQKERRKTVHIGEPDQVEVEDRTLCLKKLGSCWVNLTFLRFFCLSAPNTVSKVAISEFIVNYPLLCMN